MVFWEGYLSDEMMGTFAPIIVYWLYSGFYHFLEPMDRYRMHSRKEEEMRNLVPPASVAKGVLLQQGLQAFVAIILFTTGSLPGYYRPQCLCPKDKEGEVIVEDSI